MKSLKLTIFSIIGISFFACSIEDNFVNNQEYLSQKNIKFKNISYDEFNKKTNFVKNKPNLDGLMFKNNNVFSRTEGENSEYLIYTDKISEVNKDEYTSYTMLLKTPNSSENIFYNIIFEIKNEMTTIFIVKYTKSNNGFLDELITTYRSSEDFLGGGSNLLQVYIEDFENAVGSVGTPTSTGSGGMNWSSLGGSTIYPTDCNGTVSTTYVLEPHNCASNTHSPSQINDCEYLNPNYEHYDPSKGPYTELITYFTCIPSPIEGNNNPPTGDNSLNGGNSSTTNEENSSFTAITTDENECVVPRGDLNNDCILDQDESNFVTFLENLTTEERRLVNEDNNLKISFFNFLKGQSWSNESKYFITELIDLEINRNLLSFFPTFKYPVGSNYSAQYPKLTEYLKNKIPELKNNQFVINKLVQYSELSSQQVINDLKWGQGPTIQIAQLDIRGVDCYGIFSSVTPNVLTIDIDFVNLLENSTPGPEGDSLAFLLGVTILHEYVHLGDFVDGIDQPGEEGLLFEQATYGETIWLNNAGEVLIKWQ